MENNPTVARGTMLVVAGALAGGDGRWLMQRRPDEKPHGGLWEFPGGKVEPAEIPVEALCRELREELGITVVPGDCAPATFAQDSGSEPGHPPIVILLYIVPKWDGLPRSLEGGALGWFTPDDIAQLATPPLDRVLARQLFASE